MPIDNKEKEGLELSKNRLQETGEFSNSNVGDIKKERNEFDNEAYNNNFENESGSNLKDNQESVNVGENQGVGGIYNTSSDPAFQVYKKIEKIMEEDLADLYNSLNYKQKLVFKAKGEETAKAIFQLIYKKSKIKVKKIIKLIRNWLKLIPGVNKFFLEQEAKIKADKIIFLAENDKKIQF